MWTFIVEDENQIDIKCINRLYESWGMPDSNTAAVSTFKHADLDRSGFVDYDEFKKEFKMLIEGMLVNGELDDSYKKQQHLVKRK